MRQPHSWEITDEFWARAEPLIPPPSGTRRRNTGAGRRPVPPRTALAGIFFALRTGIPWNALPERFGSPSPVYRSFRRWCAAGFFEVLWKAGLAAYDEAAGIDWTRVSGGGANRRFDMTKAPLAQESVGRNPTDRGKKREQRTFGSTAHPV